MLRVIKSGIATMIGIFLFGCNEAELPNLKNHVTESFFASYSIDAAGVKDYVVDGLFIAPFFSPVDNYKKFELGVSVFSEVKESSIFINKIEIPGLGEILSEGIKVMEMEEFKSNELYRKNFFLAKTIDTKDLVELMQENEKIDVFVHVQCDGKLRVLKYAFYLEYETIAAPIH